MMTDVNKNNSLIKVEHLKKQFGTNYALNDVNVEIKRGEVVFIIGPSGSGKSTLLRCLNLLEEPTDGHIYFEGNDLTSKGVNVNKLRQKMGMVYSWRKFWLPTFTLNLEKNI